MFSASVAAFLSAAATAAPDVGTRNESAAGAFPTTVAPAAAALAAPAARQCEFSFCSVTCNPS